MIKMSEAPTLSIRKFNFKEMDINSKVLITAKPAMGKSSLIKDLLYRHRKRFPCGVIMSGTEEASGDFKGMVPDSFMYGSYNQEAVDRIVLRQKSLTKRYGEGSRGNEVFLVLDDVMDDPSWIKNKNIVGIFKNGRHWDIFFCLAIQYCLGIPPALRTCIDYVFILREPNLKNRRKLWENYAGIFPTFDMFCQCLDNLTEDYHCMVIKNRVISNKIEDVVFWYKAKLRPNFRLGNEEFWQFHRDKYNEHYASEEDRLELERLNGNNGVVESSRKTKRGSTMIKVKMRD
jgi:hypothetical protein